jgi:DNA-binding MarR family transcriptional regulator
MDMSSDSNERQALLDRFLYESQVQTANTVLLEQAIAERLKIGITDLHSANLLRIMGPMTAGKIAELTGFTTGAVTGMLDRLEKMGFVRRETDPQDRRRVFVHAQSEAMDAAVGPFYESLMNNALLLVAHYSDEQLEFMLTHMKRNNTLMLEEAARIRDEPLRNQQREVGFVPSGETVVLPLANITKGHLIVTNAGTGLHIKGHMEPADLLRGRFSKPLPMISTDEGMVKVLYPESGMTQGAGSGEMSLNGVILWRMELALNSTGCTLDLLNVRFNALDIKASSSDVELTLPPPASTATIRVTGAGSTISVKCQPDTPLKVNMRRGAGELTIDGIPYRDKKRYETEDYEKASGRYEIDVTARLTSVAIENA